MEQLIGKELQERSAWKFPHIGQKTLEQVAEAAAFCERYKESLGRSKMEREYVNAAVEILKKTGYVESEPGECYQPEDKVYINSRGKAVIATTYGTEPVAKGARINDAHTDSSRLDLESNPLYEKSKTILFKTHYYDGARKYQWGTILLIMYGAVTKGDGEMMKISLGRKPGDPVFCVTNLLPYLPGRRNKREFHEELKGEELNTVAGSVPYADEKELEESVKLLVLRLLYGQYGITEDDFMRVEIGMVPVHKASDVGLDRSLAGAYGQDDRACAYTALMAKIEMVNPACTTVTIPTDKEEIGSVGSTGLSSNYAGDYITYLVKTEDAGPKWVFRNSVRLSSDMNAAFDPTFSAVYDVYNLYYVSKGCVLTKYTGAREKSGSSDAGAELMAKVTKMMEDTGMYWQTGELGAVDAGGGRIIARYVAHLDIDVVNLGVSILSTYTPFELVSKLDVYNTCKVLRTFYTAV